VIVHTSKIETYPSLMIILASACCHLSEDSVTAQNNISKWASSASLRWVPRRSLMVECSYWHSHLNCSVSSLYKRSACSRVFEDGNFDRVVLVPYESVGCPFVAVLAVRLAFVIFSSSRLQSAIRSIISLRYRGRPSLTRITRRKSIMSKLIPDPWFFWSCSRSICNLKYLTVHAPSLSSRDVSDRGDVSRYKDQSREDT